MELFPISSRTRSLCIFPGVLSSLCTAYGGYWQHIGTSLGLSNLLLDGIMATTDDQCLLEVLLVWVSTNPAASWQTLSSTLHEDLNINDLGTLCGSHTHTLIQSLPLTAFRPPSTFNYLLAADKEQCQCLPRPQS